MNQFIRISIGLRGRSWLLALVIVFALAGNLTLAIPAHAVTLGQVSAGSNHTCGLTTSSGVVCWGYNVAGQLGNGNNSDSNIPMPVSGLTSGVSAISAGGIHTCALTTSGGVVCWGSNGFGQLGTGNNNDSNVPVPVSGLTSGVSAISAGTRHTCALTTNGGVVCWGHNYFGELGNGNNNDSNVPVPVSGLTSGVSAISVGDSHTCALTTSGGVVCWGWNLSGQLGNGNNNDSNLPTAVSILSSGVSAISTGDDHTCAVFLNNGLMCWGSNSAGELGTGNNNDSNTPVPVSGLTSGVSAISAGGSHTCAVAFNNGLMCWGANYSGQLGTGNNSNSNVPVPVSGLTSGVSAISLGRAHTCAVTTVGNIPCWGWNVFGQLGNGNNTDSNVPTSVDLNAIITVVLDMQPDSNANIQFAGDLGNFQLDNPTVDDGDAYTTTKKFIVNPGTYILAEVVPTPYFAGVNCVGNVTRTGQSAVSLTLSANQQVVCTFTNQRAGQITASKYNDHNHNHVRNATDEWLSGWEMQLFTSPGAQVSSQTTDATGRTTFTNLRPGGYTVCETPQSGWFNITPNVLTRPYQKPCYAVTVNPGQTVATLFGNSTTPLVAAAEVGAFSDGKVINSSTTDDEGNAVTPGADPRPAAAEAQANRLFLPLVTR
ncbi:MAG: SdrD B-like domain-containing protein [Caldilineaceae bacterium]